MAKPVKLVELRVETGPIPSTDQSDPQTRELSISHPPHVASPATRTPIHTQNPKSQPYIPDYENVGADYAIVAKRNRAAWRACREIDEESWRPALGMDAEVAECDYLPAGWPPATRCVVRRVRLSRDELRCDPRSRRRPTIDPNQLCLLEEGEIGFAYAYSFILTNLRGDVADIEAWFRQRALVEERIKDSKWGMALRHLPSGYEAVNTTWMWAALLALNCSAPLQSLARLDTGPDGRAHGKRLRRELICVAARVVHHARKVVVRPAPEHRHGVFADAWQVLSALPSFAGP